METLVLSHDGTAVLQKKIRVTTVILSNDEDDPNHELLHMFSCYNCKNNLFQYQGRVISIMPGVPPLMIPILVKCKVCGKVFNIKDIT